MTTKEEEQSEHLFYNKLKSDLIFHKYLYYVLSDSDITDRQYDRLEKQFDKIADVLHLPGSWVGWRSQDEVSMETTEDVPQDKRETFD